MTAAGDTLVVVPEEAPHEANKQDTRTEEEIIVENLANDLSNPFSTKAPRDCLSGAGSGAKNAAKGVALGLGAFIGAPIMGALEDGLMGFVKGLMLGVVTGIALPLAGFLVGLKQIIHGLINTPKAVRESIQGDKMWDKEDRKWVSYSLQEEYESMKKMSEDEYFNRKKNGKAPAAETGVPKSTPSSKTESTEKPLNKARVKDMEYYEILKIHSDASAGEIKRAYYIQARKMHPDKNKDDPSANEKFQKIGAAYQVLSDAGLRSKYDKMGKDGVEGAPMLDPNMFYTMIFGSEKFNFFVGELKLAMLMMAGEDAGAENLGFNPFDSKAIQFKQAKREVECAVNIASFLDSFVEEYQKNTAKSAAKGGKEPASSIEELCPEFLKKVEAEAKELANSPVGGTLLKVLGGALGEQAKIFLGFEYSISAGMGFVEVKRKGHVLGTQYKLVRTAIDGYFKAKEKGIFKNAEEKEEEKKEGETKIGDVKANGANGEKKEEEVKEDQGQMDQKQMMEGLVILVDTLWRVTIIDVESTMRKVSIKMLMDSSVSREVRRLRAKGLQILAKSFKKHGKSSEEGLNEIKQMLQRDLQFGAEDVAQEADAPMN